MGSEMAYNLFSRTITESNGSAEFVVCDALVESAEAFSNSVTTQFPGTRIRAVSTPAE